MNHLLGAPSSPSTSSQARPQPLPPSQSNGGGRSLHSHSSHGPPPTSSNSRRYRAPAPGGEFDRSLPVVKSAASTSAATELAVDPSTAAGPSSSSRPEAGKSRMLFNPGGDKQSGPPISSQNRTGGGGGSVGTRSISSAGRRERGSSSNGNHALPNQTISSNNPVGSGSHTIVINPHPGDRQLFDPRLHDPVRFSLQSRSAPSVSSNSTGTTGTTHLHSTSSASQSTALSSIHEPGDRERERRKRREGSERKSSRAGDRDETKSRSSEGSESLKDRQRGKGGDTGVLGALRERYRGIQALEASLLDVHRRMGRDETFLLGSGASIGPGMGDDGWVELISRHMKLAHAYHDFLTESLDPRLPASLHTLPVKYNIPARLWQNGFHLIIERIRTTWLVPASSPSRDLASDSATSASASSTSERALEHLTDYILDAYSFYTALLDENVVKDFRSAWIEALGDLARYRMAVANHVSLLAASSETRDLVVPTSIARIDDEDVPQPSGNSIGKDVADSWDVEDRDTWRTTARDWYAIGVAEKPGEGRLHHRLALISREVKGEEQRALYHFSKSLITNNPFASSRESLLPLFDSALQSKRFHPDANASELFVLLHGMIFTKIQLDDFDDIFARFFERLEEERLGTHPISQVEWIQMGVINLAACLQYGIEDGLLKKAGVEETTRKGGRKEPVETGTTPQAIMVHSGAKRGGEGAEDAFDVGQHVGSDGGGSDDLTAANGTSAAPAEVGEVRSLVKKVFSAEDEESLPLPFRHALRLSFSILSFCLAHPMRKDRLDNSILNPYIPIFLTFLSTIIKQPAALALVERSVPWSALVSFFNTIPRKVDVRVEVSPKLTGGGPLPEDWCLRGMEWVGRKVFERGFWKQKPQSDRPGPRQEGPRSTQAISSEMDVLQFEPEGADVELALQEGIVDGETDNADAQDLTARRWKRVAWSLGVFVRYVPGFGVDLNGRKVKIVEGESLDGKMVGWERERVKVREEMEAKLRREEDARGEWTDAESGLDGGDDEEYSDDDGEDDPDLRELKAQRRHLRSILQASRVRPRGPRPAKSLTTSFAALSTGRAPRGPRPTSSSRNLPSVLAGYTVLVFDTNVLLSSLALFVSAVESSKWTVMVPLPVITELDGLSNQPAPLGTEASKALAYLTSHIRTHSRTLKVQTSRGNYLADLTIRAEDITFSFSNSYNPERARNMDDLILRACSFQEEHFVDRTGILRVNDNVNDQGKEGMAKVVLMTFDRNLRLRARARGVESVDEKGMKKVLALEGGD
ncbi:hypothetical protein BDY24DRAFT_388530 [Mrakia frigida]|uniref:uncharacterized protein n=1 Tax=Mrakia frigida TaxID=29902 RepID=UPI003FCBEE32